MGWSTHATGTNDPPEVRNWTIHSIALVASMSALASQSPLLTLEISSANSQQWVTILL